MPSIEKFALASNKGGVVREGKVAEEKVKYVTAVDCPKGMCVCAVDDNDKMIHECEHMVSMLKSKDSSIYWVRCMYEKE